MDGLADTHSAADIISTVEFDHTGDYLATGDKGGRVVLFERNEQVSHLHRPSRDVMLPVMLICLKKRGCEYKFYTEVSRIRSLTLVTTTSHC